MRRVVLIALLVLPSAAPRLVLRVPRRTAKATPRVRVTPPGVRASGVARRLR